VGTYCVCLHNYLLGLNSIASIVMYCLVALLRENYGFPSVKLVILYIKWEKGGEVGFFAILSGVCVKRWVSEWFIIMCVIFYD
jgi:hypothetical protein